MSIPLTANDALRLKLNHETARMRWDELQRFFAAGLVIQVDDSLDLIDVAVAFTNDEKDIVQSWLARKMIVKTTDAQAGQWLERNVTLWAVVVRPWILVQQEKPATAPTASMAPAPTVH